MCFSSVTLREVLIQLRSMTTNKLLSAEDDPVLIKLVNMLRDPIALQASNLEPLEILGILGQAEVGWRLPDLGLPNHKESIKKRVPVHKPHISVIQELRNMLTASLPLVPKTSPLSMVICVDTRYLFRSNKECYPMSTLVHPQELSHEGGIWLLVPDHLSRSFRDAALAAPRRHGHQMCLHDQGGARPHPAVRQ